MLFKPIFNVITFYVPPMRCNLHRLYKSRDGLEKNKNKK